MLDARSTRREDSLQIETLPANLDFRSAFSRCPAALGEIFSLPDLVNARVVNVAENPGMEIVGAAKQLITISVYGEHVRPSAFLGGFLVLDLDGPTPIAQSA